MRVDLARRLVTDNEARNRVGAIFDADVTEARARAATREESILFADRSARDLENQLRQLIGDPAFTVDGPSLEIAELPPAPEIVVASTDVKRPTNYGPTTSREARHHDRSRQPRVCSKRAAPARRCCRQLRLRWQ